MVDLLKPNTPEENIDLEGGALTLIGFSRIYDPEYEENDADRNGILGTSMRIKATTEAISKKKTLTKLSETLHPTSTMEAFMQVMKSSGTTFMNCTFNFK